MTHLPSNRTLPARIGLRVASLAALLAALPAHASFLQGDALAKAANVIALVDVTFDDKGDIDRESYLVEVKGGKQVVVATLPPLGKK